MLSAIFKAFTGRAGLLTTVLALLVTALIVMAVMKGLPRIEQKLLTTSEAALGSKQVNSDGKPMLLVEGRDIHLKGEKQQINALKSKLVQVEGVRQVLLVESTVPALDQVNQQDQAETDQAPPVNSLVQQAAKQLNENMAVESLPEQTVVDSQEQEVTDNSVNIIYDQSSLSLRYDGPQLQLSGHLANDDIAQFVVDSVAKAVPKNSILSSKLDGQGAPSPLQWMNQFLDTVAGLPNDAQGVIKGSDQNGVRIYPDAEQTLIQDDRPKEAIAELAKSSTSAPEATHLNENATVVEAEKPIISSETVAQQAQSETGASDNAALITEPHTPPSDGSEDLESADRAEDPPLDYVEVIIEQTGIQTPAQTGGQDIHPADFILDLNNRFAARKIFPSGVSEIDEALAQQLDGLVDLMHNHPSLLLRVVGNLDFSVDPRDAIYVGIDRAREIRDYLRSKEVESFRVFATPLPRDYAFDQRIQIIFYVSE